MPLFTLKVQNENITCLLLLQHHFSLYYLMVDASHNTQNLLKYAIQYQTADSTNR